MYFLPIKTFCEYVYYCCRKTLWGSVYECCGNIMWKCELSTSVCFILMCFILLYYSHIVVFGSMQGGHVRETIKIKCVAPCTWIMKQYSPIVFRLSCEVVCVKLLKKMLWVPVPGLCDMISDIWHSVLLKY
jgi:hypothetical protein